MSKPFLAACLYLMAALMAYTTVRALLRTRRHQRAVAVLAVIFAAFFGAVLVNAGLDLW